MDSMDTTRDKVLADFQSCTGMEDVVECFLTLEAAQWNLLDAINAVMPQDTQTLPSEHPADLNMVNHSPMGFPEIPNPAFNFPPDVIVEATPPPAPTPMYTFLIKYKGDEIIFELPQTEDVANLKTAIYTKLGITPCDQQLSGWKINPTTDDIQLRTLDLEDITYLVLRTPQESTQSIAQADSLTDRLAHTYKFLVKDETHKQQYQLSFLGTKTIAEVKQDVYAVTNINVRHQQWTGWTVNSSDDSLTLASLNLEIPIHNLAVKKVEPQSSRSPLVEVEVFSESSTEEFEDATDDGYLLEDDLFQATPPPNKIEPLIPAEIADETEAVNHFITQFESRYGSCRPDFFQGTFAEALQASCLRPAKDRKPLAIYLHHDRSVSSNVFCSELLCTETVVSYLTVNFVVYGWDMTNEINEARFLHTLTQQMGPSAATTIQSVALDHMPTIMIVKRRVRSSSEVLTVIHGDVNLDELMTRLVHSVEIFHSEMGVEIQEEEQREAREEVKREQDKAYEESLRVDRAKDEAKQKKDREVQMEKEKEEEMTRKQDEIKEARRQSLIEKIPAEPQESSGLTISKIRMRLPNGETILRKFEASTELKILLIFLAAEGYPSEEFKVLAGWPRQDLSGLDHSKTLKELNLYPQETVTLEER